MPHLSPSSRVLYTVLSVLFALLFFSSDVSASQNRDLFGPEVFTRTSGATDIYTRSFIVPSYVSAPYTLHIKNGNPVSDTNKVAVEDAVSSASVWINGVKVAAENEFNKAVNYIDKTVTLNQTNTLEVRLNSAHGSYITATISGVINLGSLNQQRSGHTANILSDGRVLITGGNSVAGILSSAEIFDPSTLSFSLLPNGLTTPRVEHTATLLPDSDTMLIAGKDPLGALFTAELFDLASGIFTQVNNPLKNLRSGHTSTILPDGKALIIGGIDASDIPLQGAEVFDPKAAVIFDPKTGAFNTLPNSLSTPRANHTATLLPDRKVLIIGGKNDAGILSSIEIFDPETQTFTPLANTLTTPRYGHTATLLPDSKVLILGGSDGSSILSSAEIYDPNTSTFTLSSSALNTPRFNHTATLLPYGEILITGGEDQTGILSTAEFFGPPAHDITSPNVLAVNPASSARDINPNTIISVSFSEAIDVRTLSQYSFTLTGPDGAANGTVSPGESGLLAFFVPTAPLSHGTGDTYTLNLSSEIKDISGNPLASFTSAFAIDTTPPAFTGISPAHGTILTESPVIISGSVDDPDATVSLEDMASLGATMISSGQNFSYQVPLKEGVNTLTFTASDKARNSAQTTIILTYRIPLLLSITSPASGVTVTTYTVTVSGTATGPSGISMTVNGIAANRDSNGNYSADITLTGGLNTIIVTAQSSDGQMTSQTIQITYEEPNPLPPDPTIVATAIDPTVATTAYSATAFLFTGNNPIQTGVTAGTIQPTKIAALRGKVSDDSGSPLSGVKITILNHTEYGSTLTRADGMFDMAVNGGGWLTVNYQKDGYLAVQRQVNAPWQDYAWLPDVVMIQYDTKVTTIDLNSTTAIQVAQGNPTTDADGTRTATLLFQQGSTAVMNLADGTTQPITNLNIRTTEYTVGTNGPKRMPAVLPPTSGYTYAVEFSADEAVAAGAKSITFSKPVISYTENFLNFPVGAIVPVGYYDKDKGVWIPSDNGIIIKILSITNGMADIDINGTNTPASAASLSSLGITDAERQQLATLYQAGQSLWRVRISHFTPWDYNWPYGPPSDATTPKQPESETDDKLDEPACQDGSIIECENQTFGESINITGTPFSVNYRSNRVTGRKAANTIKIPLSGATIPSSLKRIDLEIYVAGRQFAQTFSAAPNQNYTFIWDGKDAYGRTVQGRQDVAIRIGFVYQAVYAQPAQFASSFGSFSGVPITGSRARQEITLWQEEKTGIGAWDAKNQGIGAWTLNIHHAYATAGQTLYLGDGAQRSVQDISKIITTTAGNGTAGYSGDGGPATSAQLYWPSDVEVDEKGHIFIADFSNNRVRKVATDGTITTVAGNGMDGYTGDGGPALDAHLRTPFGIAVDPQGNIFISGNTADVVRKVNLDGVITTVAGTGYSGFSGDGGPATSAQLNKPSGLAVDGQGNLYITDRENQRVRKVDSNGIITTVAGNGNYGYSGDGGSATGARLADPENIAVDFQGNLYIADSENNRVRKINPYGIIITVAGNALNGYGGDGGPAINAVLSFPRSIALDPQGNIFISDYGNQRIRKISPDGIITTVAGNGSYGYSGDGSMATSAKLYYPWGMAVDNQGNLYIADTSNHRIRKVSPSMPGFTNQDIAIPSEDGKELYQFDQYGKHLKTIDAITGVTKYTFTYNTAGLFTSITDRDGNITTIERDGSGNATAIVAFSGQRTAISLDANGYLASITNPNNETHQMTYTADGLMTQFTDPKGNVHTFTYDTGGRLTKDTSPIGGYKALTRTDATTSYTVAVSTALGRTNTYTVESLSTGDTKRTNTDPNGLATVTNIGTNGTTTTTSPDGTITSKTEGADPRWGMQSPVTTALTIKTPSGLTYSLSGSRTATLSDSTNLLSLTSATDTVTLNGKTWTSSYDASLKKYTFTTPVGRKSYTTLDTLGRVASEQFDSLNATNYSYDTKGRLTTVTSGQGSVDSRTYSIAYDPVVWALPTSITDPLGRSVNFVYDNAGRVTQKTLPDGRTIMFAYDANGNVTSITPPSKPAHSFTYTGVDLEETYNPPLPQGEGQGEGGVWNTQYSYNLDKQLTLITRPDSQTISLNYDTGGRLSTLSTSTLTLTYGYSTSGNLTTITAPSETLSFTYDGSLLKTTTWAGAITGSVGFTYNNDFRISAETVNGANSISFTYDNDGLLTGAGSLSITRNTQNGFITGTILGLVTTSQSYNNFGEISQYTTTNNGSTLFDVQYTRDNLGRITQKVETINGLTFTYTYIYDLAGRLTEVKRDGTIISQYSYDSNSNRVGWALPTSSGSATYDNQDRLLTYGNNTYTYSANGELQSKTSASGTTTYQYDVLGNLLSATLPNGAAIEYVVDGQNRKIGKKVNGVMTQGFLYQDQLRPLAELDGSGNIVSRFIYGTKINVPEYMIRGGVTYRFITDHLGSPRFVIDTSTGTVAQELDYDEFGNIIFDTNPGFQPFGFAGGIYDNHTKLTRFGARDYDAETGRWTAKDPIGFNGGSVNLYGYLLSDPLNWVDPEGLQQRTPITGQPNSQQPFPDGKGGRTDRIYGPDGRAIKDMDYGHNHPTKDYPEGPGDPHAHDWNGSDRSTGRPLKPSEIPVSIPWWQRVPLRWPGPFPLFIPPEVYCQFDPSLPGCSCSAGGA